MKRSFYNVREEHKNCACSISMLHSYHLNEQGTIKYSEDACTRGSIQTESPHFFFPVELLYYYSEAWKHQQN